jgi:hypothetical protein
VTVVVSVQYQVRRLPPLLLLLLALLPLLPLLPLLLCCGDGRVGFVRGTSMLRPAWSGADS